MRKYQFDLSEDEYVDYSTYIHWVGNDCKNYLVGRVSHVSNSKEVSCGSWYIEYFKDCLSVVKDMNGFFCIPGCPLGDSLVYKYIGGKVPFFLEQRIINRNRSDLNKMLERLNMKYLIPLEYIDKTNGVNIENRFFTSHNEDASAFYHPYLHFYSQPVSSRKTKEEFVLLNGEYKEDGILRTSEKLNNPRLFS